MEIKALLEKANSDSDIDKIIVIINRSIIKTTASLQMAYMNQLYHMRGLCHMKVKQYEMA